MIEFILNYYSTIIVLVAAVATGWFLKAMFDKHGTTDDFEE